MTSELLTKHSFGEEDMNQYLRDIRQFPLLTPEQERMIAHRCAQGDEEAIRQMVNSNLRLVVSVAREYAGRGVPLMDLIQEGSIGLLAAAKKFDYTLDYRFSTYATKWIRQGIHRCLANHSMIRVPAHTGEKIRKLLLAKAELTQKKGSEPTESELASFCDLTEDRVRQLLLLSLEVWSLDAPMGEESDALGFLLEDSQAPQPYEELVQEELNQIMVDLLSTLDPRQQQVLRLHFGMEDCRVHSLDEIGQILGVSKERVRQIEKQAMDKLQKQGQNMGLEDFLK